jgi:hypothetical protein
MGYGIIAILTLLIGCGTPEEVPAPTATATATQPAPAKARGARAKGPAKARPGAKAKKGAPKGKAGAKSAKGRKGAPKGKAGAQTAKGKKGAAKGKGKGKGKGAANAQAAAALVPTPGVLELSKEEDGEALKTSATLVLTKGEQERKLPIGSVKGECTEISTTEKALWTLSCVEEGKPSQLDLRQERGLIVVYKTPKGADKPTIVRRVKLPATVKVTKDGEDGTASAEG